MYACLRPYNDMHIQIHCMFHGVNVDADIMTSRLKESSQAFCGLGTGRERTRRLGRQFEQQARVLLGQLSFERTAEERQHLRLTYAGLLVNISYVDISHYGHTCHGQQISVQDPVRMSCPIALRQ